MQNSKSGRTVLNLRLFILHRNDNTRRNVSHSNGGVRRIHRLTTGAGRTEDIDLQFGLGNLNVVRRLDQRNNLNSSERGLATSLVIKGADTHEAVGAGFDRKSAIGVRGLDLEGCGLQASFFCVGRIHNLRRIPVALCPAQVHAQQDLSEICSIHAASATSDGDDCIALVIFAIKKSTDLKGGHIVLQ